MGVGAGCGSLEEKGQEAGEERVGSMISKVARTRRNGENFATFRKMLQRNGTKRREPQWKEVGSGS